MVVKPDPDHDDYEIWLIKPVHLGNVQKAGTQRVVCAGLQFTNINSAAQHLLAQRGEPELAKKQRHFVKSTVAKKPVKGLDMVAIGTWHRFATSKQLDVRDSKLFEKTFYLSREELVEFGLQEPGG